MDKRKLHHVWAKLRILSHWYFLILCIVFAVIAIFALRNNNMTAIKLRENVNKTDQANGDVEAALRKLRQYVYGHMNTQLATENGIYPPIQLKYRYERLVADEKRRVSAANAKINTDAQVYCDAKYPPGTLLSNRVACNQQYYDSHPAQTEQPIPDSMYKFDFVAPIWSPDLAGWSIVLSAIFGLLAAVRWGLDIWLRRQLDI